jgi:hypothetical protein
MGDYADELFADCSIFLNERDALRKQLEDNKQKDVAIVEVITAMYDQIHEERDNLREQLDIAVEALKPFANEDNWMWGGETDCGYPYSPDWVGNDEPWKSAQEALKRLEE